MKRSVYSHQPLVSSHTGGVLVRGIIVIVTLAIVGIAIYSLLETSGRKQQNNHRKALAISEYGLMVALQKVQSGPASISDLPRTAYDEGWYKVTMHQTSRNDTLLLSIDAEGHYGSSSERRTCILRRTTIGEDTTWVRVSMH